MTTMSHHTRFLAVLAVGVVFYVVMTTVEMEKRSHHLSKNAHNYEKHAKDASQAGATSGRSVDVRRERAAAVGGHGGEKDRPSTVDGAGKGGSALQSATLQELEKFAAEQAAKAAAAKKALEAAKAATEQQSVVQEQQVQEQQKPRQQLQKQQQQEPASEGTGGDRATAEGLAPAKQQPPPSHEEEQQQEAKQGGGGNPDTNKEEKEEVDNAEDAEEGTGGEGEKHEEEEEEEAEEHQAAGAAGAAGAPSKGRHRRHGGHQAAPAAHGGGPDGLGALPGTPTCAECSHHGICRRDSKGKSLGCKCAILYTGAPDCSKVRDFPKPTPMQEFQGRYDKSLILSKANVEGRAELLAIKDPTGDSKAKRRMAPVTKVNSRLLRVLPDKDPTDGRIYETCAIVGSSGILLRYKRGAEIDSHDMVFRFNSAPTKGFEEFCGRKTTHRITNSRNFAYREFMSEIDMQHMRSPNNIDALVTHKRRHPRTRLFGIHTDFINYMDQSLDFLATSGLFGIFIAMHKCASIDIYGFQVHARHGVQYHYYNPKDKPANEGRDDTEFEVIKALANAQLFKFSEPCILECHVSLEECERCKAEAAAAHA